MATFLDALNGTLTSSTALSGAMPENLRSAAGLDDGALSSFLTEDMTPSRALMSDGDGKLAASAVTATEQGYLSGVTSAIQTQINGKEPTITAGTTAQVWQGDKTWVAKTALPISTATQTALDTKEPTISAGTTAQVWQGDKSWVAKTALPISTATQTALDAKEPTIVAGTSADIWQGDKTWTTKLGLPISTATQAALDLKLTTTEIDTVLAAKSSVSGGALNWLLGVTGSELRKLPVRMLTAAMFLAVGDGVADDTDPLNDLYASARTTVVALGYKYIPVVVDLTGGTYRITDTIDATGIQAWNFLTNGGTILAQCAGKPAFDLTGSRGYAFRDTHIEGSSTSMPTMPFLIARATSTFSFCDNVVFDRVTVDGHFSVAAFYEYAQETTTHIHCHYWNSCPTASVAIFEGYPSHPQTSAFKTVVSSGQSHINNLYLNCDFRYQPVTGVDRALITGITRANPAVVTCAAGHPYVNGDTVIIAHIEAGMTQINSKSAVVANVTATTFEMTGVDSSAYSVYTTGGHANRRNTQPAIYTNRMKQNRFIGCYVVSYSEVAIELGFPDTNPMEQCTFDFLQEGACSSIYKFTGVGAASTQTIRDTVFTTFATHAGGAFFDTDGSAAGRLVAYGCAVKVTSHIHSDLPLVTSGKEAIFAFYGIDLFWFTRSKVLPASYTAFNGKFFAMTDGKTVMWNLDIASTLDGSYTPVVTPQSGSITTYTSTGYALHLGEMVDVTMTLTITDNGTGAGTYLQATVPVNAHASGEWHLVGRERGVGGQAVVGRIDPGANTVKFYTDDNTYPAATGAVIAVSGRYRKA